MSITTVNKSKSDSRIRVYEKNVKYGTETSHTKYYVIIDKILFITHDDLDTIVIHYDQGNKLPFIFKTSEEAQDELMTILNAIRKKSS
jgi:hypothetical protein